MFVGTLLNLVRLAQKVGKADKFFEIVNYREGESSFILKLMHRIGYLKIH